MKSKLRVREVQVQLSPSMPLAGNAEEALETAAISAAIDVRLHPLLEKESVIQPTINAVDPSNTESALVADAVEKGKGELVEGASRNFLEEAEQSILSRVSRPEELSDMAKLIMSTRAQEGSETSNAPNFSPSEPGGTAMPSEHTPTRKPSPEQT